MTKSAQEHKIDGTIVNRYDAVSEVKKAAPLPDGPAWRGATNRQVATWKRLKDLFGERLDISHTLLFGQLVQCTARQEDLLALDDLDDEDEERMDALTRLIAQLHKDLSLTPAGQARLAIIEGEEDDPAAEFG